MQQLTHLDWPFFDHGHRDFATRFRAWAADELRRFEGDEGNDGKAARTIFELLGAGDWLSDTTTLSGSGVQKIDLRRVCIMREVLGYGSAIADVAFSEPWLGALPLVFFEIGRASCRERV